MSVGVSISDILTFVKLTTRTYNGWKNACGEYSNITGDLAVLQTLLLRIEAETKTPTSLFSDPEDFRGWTRLSNECRSVVEEQEGIKKKYKSLGTNRRRNWDRIRMGNKNFDDLRNRLVAKTTALSAYLAVLGMSS